MSATASRAKWLVSALMYVWGCAAFFWVELGKRHDGLAVWLTVAGAGLVSAACIYLLAQFIEMGNELEDAKKRNAI